MTQLLAALRALRIAKDIATDEKTRRTILIIILAPVLFVLLITAFAITLLTSPLSRFSWMSTNELELIEKFQKNYGYNQGIGIYEDDYIQGNDQDYGDIVFKDGAVEVVYFNQLDKKYSNQPYGTDKIGTHGCGPTSLAIVISSLTDDIVDPIEMANWSVSSGGWCEGNGSYHSLIPNAAKAYGLNVTGNVQKDPQRIVDALSGGNLVIVIMSKGHFTKGGQFIVLRGVTSEGKILVADPASKRRSEQEWDFSTIYDEARKGAGAGGAFWIISKN